MTPWYVPIRERAVRSGSGEDEGTTTSLHLGSDHDLRDLVDSVRFPRHSEVLPHLDRRTFEKTFDMFSKQGPSLLMGNRE